MVRKNDNKNEKFGWEMCRKVDAFLESAQKAAEAISSFAENTQSLGDALRLYDGDEYGETLDLLRDMLEKLAPFYASFEGATRQVEAIRAVKTPTSWTILHGTIKVLKAVGTAWTVYQRIGGIVTPTTPGNPGPDNSSTETTP